MKYIETIDQICGEGWLDSNQEEIDGGYGVAIVMSVLDGANPNPMDIAYFLLKNDEERKQADLDAASALAAVLDIPFKRLFVSGIFSKRFNLRRDKALNGYADPMDCRTAWCHIAGIASGFIGQGYYLQHQAA